jgi:hypothetical protein
MQPEIRFTPFEYLSLASERRQNCLRINFEDPNVTLKATLKADNHTDAQWYMLKDTLASHS